MFPLQIQPFSLEPIMEETDHKVSLIPDFISNCGWLSVCLFYGKESTND